MSIPYKKMTVEELVVLAQQDDLKALEELIRKVQKDVFATFSYLSKKRENVADLTQEALLKVAGNIHSLKNPKCFKSWLNQIVTHLFYDELRKSQKKPDTISFDDNEILKTQLADNKCKPNETIVHLTDLEKQEKQKNILFIIFV